MKNWEIFSREPHFTVCPHNLASLMISIIIPCFTLQKAHPPQNVTPPAAAKTRIKEAPKRLTIAEKLDGPPAGAPKNFRAGHDSKTILPFESTGRKAASFQHRKEHNKRRIAKPTRQSARLSKLRPENVGVGTPVPQGVQNHNEAMKRQTNREEFPGASTTYVHKCNICGKVCSTSHNLEQHCRTHRGKRNSVPKQNSEDSGNSTMVASSGAKVPERDPRTPGPPQNASKTSGLPKKDSLVKSAQVLGAQGGLQAAKSKNGRTRHHKNCIGKTPCMCERHLFRKFGLEKQQGGVIETSSGSENKGEDDDIRR